MKFCIILVYMIVSLRVNAQVPVRVAVAGLTHGHVDWIFNDSQENEIIVVGIYEPNVSLAKKYAKKFDLPQNLFYTDLDDMLEQVKPDAVSAFGATSEHIRVVQASAPRNIHVMVEKPLATTVADAKEIELLAEKYNIYVLTNFETSWYESNRVVKKMVERGELGEVRKVMVNDGHEGPREIGVSEEFFEILTDPVLNGGGALMDFGCYGANLMTWLLQGEKPISVTAVTNRNKPEIYAEVEDEATIILQYSEAQAVIQASWNWPFSRKDMEVYGVNGYAIAANPHTVRHRISGNQEEKINSFSDMKNPRDNPFKFLAGIVRGKYELEENDQYGLSVNVTVVEILEAAKESAATGKTIFF